MDWLLGFIAVTFPIMFAQAYSIYRSEEGNRELEEAETSGK